MPATETPESNLPLAALCQRHPCAQCLAEANAKKAEIPEPAAMLIAAILSAFLFSIAAATCFNNQGLEFVGWAANLAGSALFLALTAGAIIAWREQRQARKLQGADEPCPSN